MESLGALYFISARGDVLIQRTYRDDIDKSLATAFRTNVISSRGGSLTSDVPVRNFHGASYMYLRCANVYLVAITRDDTNAMLVMQFLSQLVEVVKSYTNGDLTEETVKSNFVLIYELLDEVLDYGWPQVTDPTMLKQLIFQRSVFRTHSSKKKQQAEAAASTLQVTGAVGWRKDGIRYKKNEVFLDVIETVSALLSASGQVLRADVSGRLVMKTFLTGTPDVKLGLNDAPDDVAFHPCVNLARFQAEQVASFVPPDGEFELMRYRTADRVELPFAAAATVADKGRTRSEVTVSLRGTFPAELAAQSVVVTLPVPGNVARAKFTLSAGRAKYDPKRGALVWKIKKFPGGAEHTLAADVGLLATTKDKPTAPAPGAAGADATRAPPAAASQAAGASGRPPLGISFQIPMHSASAVKVQYLKVWEKGGYKVDKWVRKLTTSADYHVRV